MTSWFPNFDRSGSRFSFFFGVFFKRLNAQGALWAIVVGSMLGLFRMLIDTPVMLIKGFSYEPGSALWIINKIYFQYFSVLITLVSIVVMVVVSYLTKAPDYQRIQGLTFGTQTDEHRQASRASWDWREVAASAFVLVAILSAYLYFRG